MDEVTPRRLAGSLGLLVGALLGLASPATAQAQLPAERLSISGTIGGRDIGAAGSDSPIPLDPKARIPVELTIRNDGDQEESIRYVRLEGKALGLTFLTYDLGVRAVLRPADRTEVETVLDFFDLESQATGYLGTSIRVYDDDGFLIGEQGFVVDVLGKPNSTLGSFALIVFGLAVFSTAVIVVNTIRRRLPANRFIRGTQFAMAGSAIGITLSLGVSILRIGFADVDEWVRIVLTPTALAFVLGYLAPGPLQRSLRDYQAEEALDVAAHVAVARTSGVNEAVAADVLANIGRPGRRSTSGNLRTSRRTSSSLRAPRKTGDDLHASLRSSARQSRRTSTRRSKRNTTAPDDPTAGA